MLALARYSHSASAPLLATAVLHLVFGVAPSRGDVHFRGGEVTVAAAIQGTSTPLLLGWANGDTDALVGWIDAGGVELSRVDAGGVDPPRRIDAPSSAPPLGLGLALTIGGAPLASWLDGGDMRTRRLLPNGTLAPTATLADDVAATSGGLTVAPAADGSLQAAYLRRELDSQPGAWWDSVAVRRFSRGGRPLGPSRRVSPRFGNCNFATLCGSSTPGRPRLVRGASSSLVVWETTFQHAYPAFDAGSGDLHGLILDAAGVPLAGDFLINDYRLAGMSSSAVAALPDGGFVVAWVASPNLNVLGDRVTPQDGDGAAVIARLLNADGTPRGPEVVVNTLTAGNQWQPAVATAADGSLAIVWASDENSIRGQAFAADLSRVGGEWVVNSTGPEVVAPSIAAVGQGEWLVGWRRQRYGLTGEVISDLLAQRFTVTETDLLVTDAPAVLTLSEGGEPGVVLVRLRRAPTSAVTVPVALRPDAGAAVEPTELTYTPLDWDVPQAISVRGVDDGVVGGDRGAAVVFGPLVSDDPDFAGARPSALRVAVQEAACRLEVFQPQAELRLTVGQLATASWRATGEACGDVLGLALVRGGVVVTDLGTKASVPDADEVVTGQFRVPLTLTPAADYRLRLSTLGAPIWSGESGLFELRPRVCRVKVLSPNGGERWKQGSGQRVEWTASGPGCGSTAVAVELLRGRTAVREIAAAAPNSGAVDWTVPVDLPRAANYRVRVTMHGRPEVHDVSDRVFLVVAPNVLP